MAAVTTSAIAARPGVSFGIVRRVMPNTGTAFKLTRSVRGLVPIRALPRAAKTSRARKGKYVAYIL